MTTGRCHGSPVLPPPARGAVPKTREVSRFSERCAEDSESIEPVRPAVVCEHRRMNRGARVLLSAACVVALVAGCTDSDGSSGTETADDGAVTIATGPEGYGAIIRRTSDGVPHVYAEDLGGVTFGQGWASAQDHPCDLVDQIIEVHSERAAYLRPGRGGRVPRQRLRVGGAGSGRDRCGRLGRRRGRRANADGGVRCRLERLVRGAGRGRYRRLVHRSGLAPSGDAPGGLHLLPGGHAARRPGRAWWTSSPGRSRRMPPADAASDTGCRERRSPAPRRRPRATRSGPDQGPAALPGRRRWHRTHGRSGPSGPRTAAPC